MEHFYLILIVPFLIVIMSHIAVTKFGKEPDKVAWSSLPKAGVVELLVLVAFVSVLFSNISNEYKAIVAFLFCVSSIPLSLKQFRHIKDSGATVAYWLIPNAISGLILFLSLVAIILV